MSTITGSVTVGGQAIPVTADLALPGAASRGVWALQQQDATPTSYAAAVADAVATVPSLTGYSVRERWSTLTTARLNQAKAIADANGLDFSLRFMAGRWTPANVLAAMPAGHKALTPEGEPFPLPFGANGTPGNPVFEDAFETLLRQLAAWCVTNGITLLHSSWYAMDWAELNHGKELRAAPGYSLDAWTEGHTRLLDIIHAVWLDHPSLVMEVPASGYGPLSSGQAAALIDHGISLFGADSPHLVWQGNGWNDVKIFGQSGSTAEAQFRATCLTKPVTWGFQAIQPWGASVQPTNPLPQLTPAQAAAAFATAEQYDPAYLEIYLPSLRRATQPSGTTGAIFEPHVAAFTT